MVAEFDEKAAPTPEKMMLKLIKQRRTSCLLYLDSNQEVMMKIMTVDDQIQPYSMTS